MINRFFNCIIIIITSFLFITSCSIDSVNHETEDRINKSSIIERCTETTDDNLQIINHILEYFEKGKTTQVLKNFSDNIIFIIEGEENIDPLAGTYIGKHEVKWLLKEYFSKIKISKIEVVNHVEMENKITSNTRLYGKIHSTSKSFNMEHLFAWEFDSNHKIEKVNISYDNYSMDMAFTQGGKGYIVSHISVSPEAAGLNWYFETYIKEFVRIAPVDMLRAAFDAPVPLTDIPSDGTLTEVTINGIPGELMETTGSSDDKIILYIHGGAFIIGDMGFYRLITYNISKNTGVPVLAINYRRAPEYAFPAAPEDCLSAYQGLLNEYKPENIVIMGESAGGTLVFSTMLLAKDRNIPLPAAAVSMSPWADLTNSSESFVSNEATDVFLSPEALNNAAALYLNGASATNPIASPGFADVRGLPPVYITASSCEMLADDAATMFKKLANANNNVTIELRDGMMHVWPNNLGTPESADVYARIYTFITDNLGM